MACDENIRSIFALRGALALYSSELDLRRSCERVLESEIEEQKFLFNVLEFLSMRMCKNDAMPTLLITVDASSDPSDPGGTISSLAFDDGKGGQTAGIFIQPNTPEVIVDNIIDSLDFQQSSLAPVPGIYLYEKVGTDSLLITFKPGYVGGYSISYSTPNTPTSYIIISGGPRATIDSETGCMESASDDPDSIPRIAKWLSHRVSAMCDEKVYMTNMGPCPPADYVSCELLSSNLLTVTYYEDPVTEILPPLSNSQDLAAITISAASPILSIGAKDGDTLTIVESTTGNRYTVTYSGSGPYEGFWVISSVIPSGTVSSIDAEVIQLDPFATYSFSGQFPIKTIKGNACDLDVKTIFYGKDLVVFTPPSMSLLFLDWTADGIKGEYSQDIVAKAPAIASLYRDGAVIYEWQIGVDPLAEFSGTEFKLNFPNSILPLSPGTYSVSWPQGWVCSDQGSLAPQVVFGTYTYTIAAVASGFPFTFPYNLS